MAGLSQRMVALGTARSEIREAFAFAQQRIAQVGAEQVEDFSLGNPSVPAPELVRQTAQALLDDNQATQDFLEQTLAGAAAPRVYLAGNSSYLSTAGGAMYQNALIELGGGENVAAGLTDTYWAQVSYEQLLSWDPEVILIACDAGYTREELLGDPQLEQLSAVRSGAVYAMPSGVEAWDSPVPSALVGSRWVASVLHGDAYPFGQFQADAAEFYRNFYGFEIDPALLPDPLAW